MERLTERDEERGYAYSGYDLTDIVNKLAEYEDAEEHGLFLKKEKAVDEGYLCDWYIHSTMGDEPIWTEAHIEELFNDFILIPKEEAEQTLKKMEKNNNE